MMIHENYYDVIVITKFGKVIMCNNGNFSIRWFHFDCRIRCPPKGKWYIVHLVGNFQSSVR